MVVATASADPHRADTETPMPTDEQRALWVAIRANPDNDTPRLVYADWLQEHGDEPRAEFIRVQCGLEKLGTDRRKGRKERPALETRQSRLLAEHQDSWLSPFRARLTGTRRRSDDEWLNKMTFRRGFLDGIYFDLSTAAALAQTGDALEPVDRVCVMEMGANYDHPNVLAVARWSGAGCVTCFSIAWATDKDAAVIVHHGYLRNLSHLGLWHGTVSEHGIAELAT